MHISGLLGMPRRVWTYPSAVGWDVENLLSSIGAFLLTAGLLALFANLAASAFRGAPAGADPFRGGTLEWATTSPPPAYNFAVIPYVTSAYPCWDADERAGDRRRLETGELVLEAGHETPATTPVDGRLDEILHMPAESPWPVTLGVVATLGAALVLSNHFLIAAATLAVAVVVLSLWHSTEPAPA
jgi:hypothetical protein